MGDAQSIPVVGETVTAIESGTKIVAAGACALVGQTDTAQELAEGAGRSWVEYSEKNIVAASVNCVVQSARGKDHEAHRIAKKSLGALENVVDGTPGVGHVKGVYHYIDGDKEHGNKCMNSASRSTAVLGAGLVTGGIGGGAVLGGLAGLEAGMAYDLTSSVVQDEPAGCVQGIKEIVDTKDPNKVVDVGLGFAGDFAGGYSGAQYGEALRVKYQKYQLESSFKKAKATGKMPADFDPKQATTDTVDAAKNMRKHIDKGTIKKDGHVSTRVRNLETNEVSQGYSSRARQDINVAEFKAKGKSSGFKSKTNAKNVAKRMHSELKVRQPHVEQAPGMNRNPASCAEQQAFNNHYKQQPGSRTGNAQTVSVEYRDGSYSTVKRCPNCYEYDMGRVPTDAASGKTVPTTDASTHVKAGSKTVLLEKAGKGKRRRRRGHED